MTLHRAISSPPITQLHRLMPIRVNTPATGDRTKHACNCTLWLLRGHAVHTWLDHSRIPLCNGAPNPRRGPPAWSRHGRVARSECCTFRPTTLPAHRQWSQQAVSHHPLPPQAQHVRAAAICVGDPSDGVLPARGRPISASLPAEILVCCPDWQQTLSSAGDRERLVVGIACKCLPSTPSSPLLPAVLLLLGLPTSITPSRPPSGLGMVPPPGPPYRRRSAAMFSTHRSVAGAATYATPAPCPSQPHAPLPCPAPPRTSTACPGAGGSHSPTRRRRLQGRRAMEPCPARLPRQLDAYPLRQGVRLALAGRGASASSMHRMCSRFNTETGRWDMQSTAPLTGHNFHQEDAYRDSRSTMTRGGRPSGRLPTIPCAHRLTG